MGGGVYLWPGWWCAANGEWYVRRLTFVVLFLMSMQVCAQDWEMDIAAGALNYQGELRAQRFTSKGMRPAFSAGIGRWVGEWNSVFVRFSSGTLTGRDSDNPNYVTRRRNLDFETLVHEFNMGFRQFLHPDTDGCWFPYVNVGMALFWVNPYTRDQLGMKYSLYDLSLEGQGLPQFPTLKVPSPINLSMPFGAGLAFRLTESLRLDIEMMARKTFTDQIDGVGGYYPPMESLKAMRGSIAVDLSYRSDELVGEDPVFPPEGTLRGNPKTKDWYYGLMLRFVWHRMNYRYSYPPKRKLFKPKGWPYRL